MPVADPRSRPPLSLGAFTELGANVYVNITRGAAPVRREDGGRRTSMPTSAHHEVSVPAIALSIAVRRLATGRKALGTATPRPPSAPTTAMNCGVAQAASLWSVIVSV